MDKRIALVFPALAALLVGLFFHYTNLGQPGFYSGITLILGAVVYFIWAKREKDNETTGAP